MSDDARMPLFWGWCARAEDACDAPLNRGTLAAAVGQEGAVGRLMTAPTFSCVQFVERQGVLLPTGTLITCEAGHPVCRTRAPIRPGDVLHAGLFGPVREGQAAIVEGAPASPCFCGASFARLDHGRLHTSRGWMPGPAVTHPAGPRP